MHYAYNEDYLVVRKAEIDAGRFKAVADLRGKPCAINAKGVATEWVLDEVLQTGGLRIDNIDVKTLHRFRKCYLPWTMALFTAES